MRQILFFLICVLVISCNQPKEKNILISSNENEVISIVTPFTPEIFSEFTNVRDFTISPEEDEAYFTLQSPGRELSVIMTMNRVGNKWNSLKISSFSGRYSDLEPFLSPDSKRLYFASNRPTHKDSTNTKDFDIWYVERENKNSDWSEPINIGSPINTEADEFYPSITNSGNIYFTAITPKTGPQDDIFLSEWKDGAYTEPVQLSDAINTKGAEFNAYVSPDESYIIFGGWRRPDGIGSGDMYMSKKLNGEWQPATNLGVKINSKQTDYCPFVNSRTNTLYFTSRRSNVEKKDSGYINTDALLREINKYDNGSSRIYQIDFSDYIR